MNEEIVAAGAICAGGPYHGQSVEASAEGAIELAGEHGRIVYRFRRMVNGVCVYALPGISDAAFAEAVRRLPV